MGGALWGTGVSGIGYLVGAAYGRAEQALGLTGAVIAIVLAATVAAGLLYAGRHARGAPDEPDDPDD